MHWKTLITVLFNVMLALTIGIAGLFLHDEHDIYEEGRRILVEEGAESGYAFFDEHVALTGSLTSTFGTALAAWSAGDIDKAQQIANFIAGEQTQDEWLRASNLYLMGQINLRRGRMDLAYGNLSEAHTVFQRLGLPLNTYQTLIALAANSLRRNDLAATRRFLDQARRLMSEVETGHGYYWRLCGMVALVEQDYGRGREVAAKAVRAFEREDYRIGVLHARSDLAFFLIADGQIEDGLEMTRWVDRDIPEDDRMTRAYNKINLVLVRVCEGRPLGTLDDEIRRTAAELDDPLLVELLEYVISWSDTSSTGIR